MCFKRQKRKYFEEPFKCTFSLAAINSMFITLITNRQIILEKILVKLTAAIKKNFASAKKRSNLRGSELSFL